MKRIVVGTDGTDAGNTAVRWAAGLCQATGSELVIGSAWSPAGDDESEAAHERALDEAWRPPEPLPEVSRTTRVLRGAAGDALARLAIEVDADLVAIGVSPATARRNRVARHLLHHLHRPLAVVPMDPPRVANRDLVVGIDGSHASEAALRWAIDLVRDVGADVTAVFAHDPLADSYPHPDLDNWLYHGEAAVRSELERARDDAIDVDLVRPPGKPDDVLGRVADVVGAAAIIVGTRGLGGFHDRIVGGVPMRLVERATRPVIVVPH